MWLLNARNLELEYFESGFPPYAILSHTWGIDEVTFQDIRLGADHAATKVGFEKIRSTCKQALADGLEYAWVDTCCIDKSNSADLSEAINSMYGYYRSSQTCYAHLVDVSEEVSQSADLLQKSLRRSRWFYRGWCLQELLAPRNVTFFSTNWALIGTRNSNLLSIIVQITGIHEPALQDSNNIGSYSIAQRMSWAARRKTTRIEDQAYCLLGIFDINMPLLYGEGSHAFVRLQEEIIKDSTDHSIFVWDRSKAAVTLRSTYVNPTFLLAPFPGRFSDGQDVVWLQNSRLDEAYEMTNEGLRITLPMTLDSHKAVLNCSKGGRICALSLVPVDARSSTAVAHKLHVSPDREQHYVTQAEAIVCVRRQISVLRVADIRTDPIVQWSLPSTLKLKLVVGVEAGPVRIVALHPANCWDSRGITETGRESSANFVARTRDDFDLVGAVSLQIGSASSSSFLNIWFRVFLDCGHSAVQLYHDHDAPWTFEKICQAATPYETCPTCNLTHFPSARPTRIDQYRYLQYGISPASDAGFGPARDFALYLLFMSPDDVMQAPGGPSAGWFDLRKSFRRSLANTWFGSGTKPVQ